MKIDSTKSPGSFRFVSLGDVHLGHHQTPTTKIVENLDRYCTNDKVLKDVDMLIITGDLFDRLLHNADENLDVIHRWVSRVLYRCAYLDVAIRIVEGTPSHDRGQSRFFVEQAANAKIDVDLYYATQLEIEHNERFGIDILYVPDKWRPDTAETLEEVRVLMKNRGLEKVDFAIMHGAFEYQLPSIVKEPTHDSAVYLELVRYFILIGHVHLVTQLERILAAGSYDRICHGEEGPKGYYDVRVRDVDDYDIVFVENKGAKRYDTIDCTGLDTKEFNVKIRKVVEQLPKSSAIRLRCSPHDAAAGDIEGLVKQYPQFEWSLAKDREKVKKESIMDTFMSMDMKEFVPIDPTSIEALVQAELEKQGLDTYAVDSCTHRLKELVSGLH